MKASEVIAELQRLIAQHGDQPMFVFGEETEPELVQAIVVHSTSKGFLIA
jgi:hypothetical protein